VGQLFGLNSGVSGISGSISVRSLARRTFAAYAGRASVLLPAAAVTAVIVAGLDTRPAKSSPALAIGALIVTVAVIALFAGTVVKLAAEVWEGKPAVSPREFLASVRPVLGVLIVVSMNTQLRDERYRAKFSAKNPANTGRSKI
jgi:hypothetical protein